VQRAWKRRRWSKFRGSRRPKRRSSRRKTPAQAVAVPLPAGSDDWFETVTNLGLSGVARMIAEHSELLGYRDGVYRLRLDSAHDTLLADGPVASLARALGARHGAPVQVRVEVGSVTTETPAVRLARERVERQREAEAMLSGDPTVQQLLSEFGGHIEGVSPIE
jgi:DNA polymerase III subunit gamma/tau